MTAALSTSSLGLWKAGLANFEARSRVASSSEWNRWRSLVRWRSLLSSDKIRSSSSRIQPFSRQNPSSERTRSSSGKNEVPSPMELWPGVSSLPDFEFGDQKPQQAEARGFDDSQDVGLSESKDSVTQPYMGDVDMLEEQEQPAKYVPPPPVPMEDVEMRNRVEQVMYTLLKCIPGPMTARLRDPEEWDILQKMFSETVEIQDPLICVKGLDSFKRLLEVLCHSGITVKPHEIYYENIAADRFKRWVYVVWTASLTDSLEGSLGKKAPPTQSVETAYGSLEQHLDEGRDRGASTHEDEYELVYMDLKPTLLKSGQSSILKLSGESRFEVNKEGQEQFRRIDDVFVHTYYSSADQRSPSSTAEYFRRNSHFTVANICTSSSTLGVTSVISRWYKLAEDGDMSLARAKLWLADLYSRNGL